jgi:Ca2+-binding RTX toxin-like protein
VGVINGTDNSETLQGSADNDILYGNAGYDDLYGGDGNDILVGGEGFNRLYGGAGDDIFRVGDRASQTNWSFDQIVDFEQGHDRIDLSAWGISSFAQLERILVTNGFGQPYFNAVYNGQEHSVAISTMAKGDLKATDFIFDTSDTPRTIENSGPLFGANGADTLTGGYLMLGGGGDDRLVATSYGTMMYGEDGNDIFVVAASDSEGSMSGFIMDFQKGADKIDVSGFGVSNFEQISAILKTQGTNDTVFNAYYNTLDRIVTIKNIDAASFTASDFIFDTGGGRHVTGSERSDLLFGSSGADILDGGRDNDVLYGGDGNDILIGGFGKDVLYGQSGDDIFRLQHRTLVSSFSETIIDFEQGSDRIDVSELGIFNFDQLKFLLENRGTSDSYFNAFYHNAEHSVTISNIDKSALKESDFIFADDSSPVIKASGWNDTIFGSSRAEVFDGGKGHDIIFAGGGNDRLISSPGGDILYGQGGKDTFVLAALDKVQGVTIGDFTQGEDRIDVSAWGVTSLDQLATIMHAQDGNTYLIGVNQSQSVYILIENIDPKDFKASDFIFDKGGPRNINGSNWNDLIFGSTGNDRLTGRGGFDTLAGGDGNDTLSSGSFGGVLNGGKGADKLIGSGGLDTASYAGAASGVAANLTAPSSNTGDAKGDTYISIENLTGSSHNDKLTGSSGDNRLSGGVSNDRLYGGKGNDILLGGDGKDFLAGGAGRDIFVFNSKLTSSNVDTIDDFSVKDDNIYLDSKIFTKIGEKFSLGPGEMVRLPTANFQMGTKAKDATDRIIYDKSSGKLWYDADGSAKGAAVLVAVLDKGLAMTSADFHIINYDNLLA